MTRVRGAIGGTALSLLVLTAGVTAAPALAGDPLDLSIAKKQDGPYLSSGQYTGFPTPFFGGDNPQWVRRSLPGGESQVTYVRLKNPNPTRARAYVDGARSGGGLRIRYHLKGEKVTRKVTSCSPFRVPATGGIRFKMTIKNVGATPDVEIYSPFSQGDADCDPLFDRVWAGSSIPG